MNPTGYAKTYPTKCRDCGEPIFFHTNGYGDVVIFDDLGMPWPIHGCYEARVGGRNLTDPTKYRAYMVSVYGRPSAPKRASARSFSQRQVTRKQVFQSDLPERPVEIDRCNPANFVGQILEVNGFVHDLHSDRSISRFADTGSIGYSVYQKVIGKDNYSQLTVIDAELVSYTVIVPNSRLTLAKGSLVNLTIEALETVSEAMFICRSLNLVRLESSTDKRVKDLSSQDSVADGKPR